MKKLNKIFPEECCDADKCLEMDDCCITEVGDTIQRMVRVFQLFERDQIKPTGFTISQCYTMIELKKYDSLTMNELSEKMNLNTSTMTRNIDKLVRDGYVIREKHEEDRRVVVVKLTTKGKEASSNLDDNISEYYRKITINLPQDRMNEVLDSVSLLLNAFEKANPNCC